MIFQIELFVRVILSTVLKLTMIIMGSNEYLCIRGFLSINCGIYVVAYDNIQYLLV